MKWILYDQATGQNIQTATGTPNDIETLAAAIGCAFIQVANDESDATHYVLNGVAQPFPARPSTSHAWDWAAMAWAAPIYLASDARRQGYAAIDAAAGRARRRYITTVPGQGETYSAKYQEALAYIEAGYPSDTSGYPFVAGESHPNSGMTPTQAATRIATIGGYWREILGPAIEGARINGKDALDAMTDPAAIDAHVSTVVATLDAI